jgi:hypothetical protein
MENPDFETVEIDVVTEDLCEVYGCDNCPGIVTTENAIPVLCIHACHRVDSDA